MGHSTAQSTIDAIWIFLTMHLYETLHEYVFVENSFLILNTTATIYICNVIL